MGEKIRFYDSKEMGVLKKTMQIHKDSFYERFVSDESGNFKPHIIKSGFFFGAGC